MTSKLTVIALMAAAVMLSACDTTPKNKGEKTERRSESRTAEGRELGSADLVAATESAVAGILNDPDFQPLPEGPTVIVMDRVGNETSDPSANFQIYLARIRALLNQAGAEHRLMFIETRTVAEDIKAREGIAAGPANRTPPRYALAGAFYDLPRNRTNFYLLTFQLVDLTSDVIVWEGSYEVKL